MSDYPVITMSVYDVKSVLGPLGGEDEVDVPEEDVKRIAEIAETNIYEKLDDRFWDIFHKSIEEAVAQFWEERNGFNLDG